MANKKGIRNVADLNKLIKTAEKYCGSDHIFQPGDRAPFITVDPIITLVHERVCNLTKADKDCLVCIRMKPHYDALFAELDWAEIARDYNQQS